MCWATSRVALVESVTALIVSDERPPESGGVFVML